MNWKGHLIAGAIFTAIGIGLLILINCYLYPLPLFSVHLLIGIILALYCSLLPDVDIKTSKAFLLTFGGLILFLIYFIYTGQPIGIAAVLILMVAIMLLKHRGIMHRWWMAPIIGCIFGIMWWNATIGFLCFMGYLSHVITEQKKKQQPYI